MAKSRYRSVHTAPPPARHPWSLGAAAVALLVYGGVAIQDTGRPAPLSDEPVAVTEAAPAERSTGPAHRGQASWYGSDFQGSPTASGEPFNMNALTAAHRTLP